METEDDFQDLYDLLDTDPPTYRREVERLRQNAPERFAAFVEDFRAALAGANQAEDARTADELGEEPPRRSYWRRFSSIAGLVLGRPKPPR